MSAVLTPAELAERWHTTAQVVDAMCRRGEVRAFKVGRQWRIAEHAVAAYEAGERGAA